MAEWVWKNRNHYGNDNRRSIEADLIEFQPHHVVFLSRVLNAAPQLILAVQNENISDLHPAAEGDPVWW